MENWKNWLNCRTKLPIGSVGRCVSPSPKDLEWVHHPKSKHFDHFFLNFTFHIRWRGPRNWKCPFLIKWMHLFPSDWLWFILRRFHIYWSKMKKTAVTTRLSIPPKSNLVHDFVIFATQLGHHNATVTAVIEEFYRAECDNVRVLLLFTLRRARYRKKEET